LWFLTFGKFLREIRGACEHSLINEKKCTNTFEFNLIDSILFNGCGMSYHFEHHLKPTIPNYNLSDFSKKVRKDLNLVENKYRSIFQFLEISLKL